MPRRVDIDCTDLRRLYEEERMDTVALAQRYNCSATTISKRLRECNIQIRPSRFQPSQINTDELRQLYEIERLPVSEIAQRFGVSVSTIGNLRRSLGIPVRPRVRIPKKPTL